MCSRHGRDSSQGFAAKSRSLQPSQGFAAKSGLQQPSWRASVLASKPSSDQNPLAKPEIPVLVFSKERSQNLEIGRQIFELRN